MVSDLASTINSGSFLFPNPMVNEQYQARRSLGGLGEDSRMTTEVKADSLMRGMETNLKGELGTVDQVVPK